jgi:CCR4-NOT transcription complex subunit 1
METDDDYSPELLATVVDRLAQNAPRNWNENAEQSLHSAVQQRYHGQGMLVPVEVSSALAMFGLLNTTNTLVRLIKETGTRGTDTVAAAKTMLQSAELRDISYQQIASALLFMVIARDDPPYQAANLIAAIREHHGGQRLDWQDVVHDFDREGVKITKTQFKRLFDALMPLALDYENFDLQLLWGGDWHQEETQLAFVCAFVSHAEDELDASQIPRLRKAFLLQDFADASEEVQLYAQKAVRHPLVSVDATKALFNMVFRSSETYLHAQNFGVVDNIINANMDLFVSSVSAVPKPWSALQDQAIKQLVASFFWKAVSGRSFALHLLWKRDSAWLAQRLTHYYQQKPLQLAQILELAQEHGWLHDLISLNNELSLDLAAVAHGRGVFDLETWLQQMAQAIRKERVVSALSQYLRGKAEDDLNTQRDRAEHLAVPLTVRTVFTILNFLGSEGLAEEERTELLRICIQAYPRLINYGEGYDHIIDANGRDGNSLSPDADAKMQEHFKLMYSADKEVREVIEDLQRYKTSEDPTDQDLFACMIFGLFDEYHCFGEYPLDALATTAVLFGSIINFSLLSRVALQVAISMVLDAVKNFQPHEAMYKFGLQALLNFQGRLEEWQALTRVLVQIPTLQGTPIYPILEKILREGLHGEGSIGDPEMPNGAADDFLAPEPRYPEFDCLSIDPPTRLDFYTAPDEKIEEAVLFNLNNVSERNLAEKTSVIKSRLQEEHFQWFAKYLVDSRIKGQPNYHTLYMGMLDELNNRTLWEEVLRETYVSVIRMINAEASMNSSNERTHLKNLGQWLGSMTLARNEAIKHRNISFKDLLIEAHDTQRLLVAIPFTCKVLSLAAQSLIFKPPSAWTMEIVYILIELYQFADLKLNLKFEIEVLCKALDLDHKELEPSEVIRSRPALDDNMLQPGLDGIEGFNELSLFSGRREMPARFSPSTMIPDMATLSASLKHQYSLPAGVAVARVRQLLSVAVERAVSEIIGPVVERSVTIAAISASQLVGKDLALEPNAERYREAAHTAVRNMAGSLAGVTCKEPLRASMASHVQVLRQSDMSEQALPQGSILMFINDNLDGVCGFVEKAAEEASMAEIDSHIEDTMEARKNGTYTEPQLSQWAYFIPEPFKQRHGGLNREQLAIYTEFGRSLRTAAAHANNISQDSGRQMDALQDQYSSMTGMPTPADVPSLPQDAQHSSAQLTPASAPQQLVNGGYNDSQIITRLPDLVRMLYQVANEAENEEPPVLLTESPDVHDAWTRLGDTMGLVSQPSKDTAHLSVAQEIVSLLRMDRQKLSVAELFARVLMTLSNGSEETAKHVYAWSAGLLHERPCQTALIVALVRCELVDIRSLDLVLSRDLGRRNDDGSIDVGILNESVNFLDEIVDGVLLSEPQVGLRADLVKSMYELTSIAAEVPESREVQILLRKLYDTAVRAGQPIDKQTAIAEAQIEYVFEEWMRLQETESVGAQLVFVRQLHVRQLLTSKDESATFFRACIDSCILEFEHEEMKQNANLDNAYSKTDALAKLIVNIIEQQGKSVDSVITDKTSMFERIMILLALVLALHYRHRGDRFNSKVFFRLFSSILYEIYSSPALAPNHVRDLLQVFGKTLTMLAPQLFPGFAFHWLSLQSHRMFMPALLRSQDDAGTALYTDLLCKQLHHTGELMYASDIPIAAQEYYRGALKLMLILHHDFPEYLAENHNEILKAIPAHCTQLRSLVVSACPTSLHDLPDPFTEGLKVDRIEDMKRAPVVRGDVQAPLLEVGMKSLLDELLAGNTDQGLLDQIVGIVNTAAGPRSNAMLNCLVLYMLRNLESSNRQRNLAFSATSAQARLLDSLVDRLHPATRYDLINAIANQLRYPNQHTHYFMYAMLHLFRAGQTDQISMDIQEQITRVFAERIIVHRPHPWGLMVTLIELLKNRTYRFWDLPFVKAAPDVSSIIFSDMSIQY